VKRWAVTSPAAGRAIVQAQHGGARQHDDGAEEVRGDLGGEGGTSDRTEQGGQGHGQRRAEIGVDAALVGDRRRRGAHDRAELVGGEHVERAQPGDEEERRELDQSAATDDGVHPARREAGEDDEHPGGGAEVRDGEQLRDGEH